MKQLNNFINEKLKINSKSKINQYQYFPKNTDELKEIIVKLIDERGYDADLNDIDTSKITDMSMLFKHSEFSGDVSKWNVSNVENMNEMFAYSKLTDENTNLYNWNVKNVINMEGMFAQCKTFTGKGIEKWDVSNVENMFCMFYGCDKFNQNLEHWNIKKDADIQLMFGGCTNLNKRPSWYKTY